MGRMPRLAARHEGVVRFNENSPGCVFCWYPLSRPSGILPRSQALKLGGGGESKSKNAYSEVAPSSRRGTLINCGPVRLTALPTCILVLLSAEFRPGIFRPQS